MSLKGKQQGTFKKLNPATQEWEDIEFMDIEPMDVFRKYEGAVTVMDKQGNIAWEAQSVPFIDTGNGNEPTVSCKGVGSQWLQAGELVVRR